ncbi:MAG TPA: DUF427 domain-containing protein [Rhizomicrobium sp.]|nr:DUF427 domain-containing protein [Rhizomicrobium sp.]
MKLPGPDHPITIKPHDGRVIVSFGDSIVADTEKALELKESTYPVVLYIPREDAKLAHYERTQHSTHCPYKGEANYFTLIDGDTRAENAVWTYETPFPAMQQIAGYVAFYPNKVSIAQ